MLVPRVSQNNFLISKRIKKTINQNNVTEEQYLTIARNREGADKEVEAAKILAEEASEDSSEKYSAYQDYEKKNGSDLRWF